MGDYINRHKVQICCSEKPKTARSHILDSPKANVWCLLRHNKIISTFFYHEKTVDGNVYAYMLEIYASTYLQDMEPQVVVFFNKNETPSHWATFSRELLNSHFPNRWTGRGGPIP
ncbi:hypothetical protein AVEN_106866-1 [Araneus ventricosus]|uniref:MULE transposase domain-containing protein n=1 Tax=Araneus ventricosus TaxID=182803 RepID=A0A4Y2R623_ARAVE|nr:hypothetical protein AVEN_8408-1 [Araneus ventricosus]GBN71192.1 hypothetical protein AVEN_106866-1 [Araneus ventricosus]